MPNAQTSDLIVNLPYIAASIAVHLIGNFAPIQKKNIMNFKSTDIEATNWFKLQISIQSTILQFEAQIYKYCS